MNFLLHIHYNNVVMAAMTSENVKVIARCRPMNTRERALNSKVRPWLSYVFIPDPYNFTINKCTKYVL